MHIQFSQIPLWPPRDFVRSHMPALFQEQYPTIGVIIDATEHVMQSVQLPTKLLVCNS